MTTPLTARKPRATWTHAQVAALVKDVADAGPPPAPITAYGHTADEVTAKLIELGLIPKPEKVALNAQTKKNLDALTANVAELAEPQRTLAARYTIAALRELLPTRAPKAT